MFIYEVRITLDYNKLLLNNNEGDFPVLFEDLIDHNIIKVTIKAHIITPLPNSNY